MTKTNDLKKGTRVKLRNGWEAEMVDNRKGNSRDMTVFGDYTETGSVYTHDIVAYKDGDDWKTDIEYTKSQVQCKDMNRIIFGD